MTEQAPHPEDLARWKLGFERYEKARKLSPSQWFELHKRNLAGEFFDDMIDALPPAHDAAAVSGRLPATDSLTIPTPNPHRAGFLTTKWRTT